MAELNPTNHASENCTTPPDFDPNRALKVIATLPSAQPATASRRPTEVVSAVAVVVVVAGVVVVVVAVTVTVAVAVAVAGVVAVAVTVAGAADGAVAAGVGG